MANSLELVYFDTCLFVELLQQDNQSRFDACEFMRLKAAKKELLIVTSAITIVETNKLPESPALLEEQSKKILAFFLNPYIAIRPVTREIAELAHEFTRTHGLTNLDAIHVATAAISKVTSFYTYDNPKKKRKGLIRHSLKIGQPPLRIEMPPDPDAGTLFETP